ncbi:DAZ-associated protein [Echinococcus granulosus]|uniref:DAZ-associated protein n=1 Tax=Echinococcus granulosus TaxID=6210 RepID=W6UU26_ECHGR|nr:DAZ-associated protein [Echinococcus granulosus]EUB61882.1 DAZ-associated protein [Echinococcus granulosus]
MGATTKDGIFGAMENAIMELRAAASKALEAATANVEVTDVAGFEILDELVSRITNLSTEVGKVKDVHTSIEETKYGTVIECCIARDCNTDESRGFGFVTFREAAQATRALADRQHFIDGGPVHVRPYNLKKKEKKKEKEKLVIVSSVKLINVWRYMRPKGNVVLMYFGNEGDENVGHKDEGGGSGSRRDVNELRLSVGNLSTSTGQQALKEYFSRYGNVTGVDIILERKSGMPRGIAFVNMSTPQEVEAVLEARPHQLSGKAIIVRPAYLRASNQFGAVASVRLDQVMRKAFVVFSTTEAFQNMRRKYIISIDDEHILIRRVDGTCSVVNPLFSIKNVQAYYLYQT